MGLRMVAAEMRASALGPCQGSRHDQPRGRQDRPLPVQSLQFTYYRQRPFEPGGIALDTDLAAHGVAQTLQVLIWQIGKRRQGFGGNVAKRK